MKTQLLTLAALTFVVLTACKKNVDPHIPPDVVFKTDAGYAYSDATVGLEDTLKVGIIATKTEDDMKSYNVSYAYDGSTSTTTFYNYLLTPAEYTSYAHDVDIVTRTIPGSERWVFTIVDRDGNITQKTINLTVQ
jgi:hypothetical protein